MSKLIIKTEIEVDYYEFLNLVGYIPHDDHTTMLEEWVDHSLTEMCGYDGSPINTLNYNIVSATTEVINNER